jgi:hypothetical protein
VAILITILTLALVIVVLLVISAPLRAAWRLQATQPAGQQAEPAREEKDRDRIDPHEAEAGEDHRELAAEREAKYREIRDTELDYRTGKLSKEDFVATDSALRAEALEILDRLKLQNEDK